MRIACSSSKKFPKVLLAAAFDKARGIDFPFSWTSHVPEK
jgi:hypothetical protein